MLVVCAVVLTFAKFEQVDYIPYDCIYKQVLKECHGILDRHQLMLEACELNSVSEDDCINVGKAEPDSCLLGGLSNWLIAYSTYLVYICATYFPSSKILFGLSFLNTCCCLP